MVSNSAEMLKAQNGTFIDANDIVVRLNLPPVEGKNLERHIGRVRVLLSQPLPTIYHLKFIA